MARSMSVTALALASFVYGILVVVAGVLLVPAFGVYEHSSKDTLYTVIGSIHLAAGLAFLASGVGAWRVARWGWTLGLVAAVLALAGGFWALISVFNTTIPIVQMVVAFLVLLLLVAVRSSFRGSEAPASPPPAT